MSPESPSGALRPSGVRPVPAALRGFDAALRRVERVMTIGAVIVIIAMMFMIAADVVLRYSMSRPIPWLYDLIAIYLLKVILYFMVSDVLAKGDHIALDYKLSFLTAPLLRWLETLAWVALAAALSVTCAIVAGSAAESLAQKEIMPGLYEWPVWIEKAAVALGLALLSLRTWLIAAGHAVGTPVGTMRHHLGTGEI